MEDDVDENVENNVKTSPPESTKENDPPVSNKENDFYYNSGDNEDKEYVNQIYITDPETN